MNCHYEQRRHEKSWHNNRFTNDKINIFGQEMDMKFTSSWHYLIPISESYEALNEFDENNKKCILLSIENGSNRILREKQSLAEKL